MNGLISQINLLQNAIRFADENHRVIAQNMANLNTPGYKTKQLSFDQLLSAIEDKSESTSSFRMMQTPGLQERSDGNNVDLDREFAGLRKNKMAYQTLIQMLGSKIDMMNRAING